MRCENQGVWFEFSSRVLVQCLEAVCSDSVMAMMRRSSRRRSDVLQLDEHAAMLIACRALEGFDLECGSVNAHSIN